MTIASELTGEALLVRARELRPLIEAHAAEAEEERRLPDAVVDAVYDAGLYTCLLAAEAGGPEIGVPTYLRLIEEVARADGSTGWCLMIGSEIVGALSHTEFAALPELLAEDRAIVAVGAEPGAAQRVEGGYRFSGRSRFASGSANAAWVGGTGPVMDGDEPVRVASGAPDVRLFLLPKAAWQIEDTWFVGGMRATASNDIVADNIFVPETHTARLPVPHGTHFSRFPFLALMAANKAAVATGIGLGARDATMTLLEKVPVAAAKSIRAEPRVQLALARAEATLEAARAYLYAAVGDAWETASAGETVTLEQIARLRIAAVNATEQSVSAVDQYHAIAGTSAIRSSSPLDRALRDVHVAARHMNVQERMLEDAGRVLVGLAPTSPIF